MTVSARAYGSEFIIFINDLDSAAELASILRKFADDTKSGKVLEGPQSIIELQQALDALVQWADKWCMAFNIQKCKVMHVGRQNSRAEYRMGGVALASTEERDIGVQITSNLKPAAQCAKAAKTGMTVLGQISRAFHYRDRHTFLRLYKQYVRPHLEFSSQAWSPWHQKDIEILKKVQERAVKMIGGLKGTSYDDKLHELGLQSLSERRREADMLMVYKVIHGFCPVDQSGWFIMAGAAARQHTRNAADPLRLSKPRANRDLRNNFFTVRVIDHWNVLPLAIRGAAPVSRFRTGYRQHMAPPSMVRGAGADGTGSSRP